jgi:hypothetical protein
MHLGKNKKMITHYENVCTSLIMFDLKFYNYIHRMLVNLWEIRHHRCLAQNGSPSEEDMTRFYNQYTIIQNAINEFIMVYPEYMYWLGLYIGGESMHTYNDVKMHRYANFKNIKLYRYDY